MSNVVIVGGGAAGMLAAIAAAKSGHAVTLYEKNEKLGKKLFITGKGRCNVTNACDVEELFGNIVTNKKFLYSAFYGFTNQDIMNLIEGAGCPLKVERGNRVFPCSDKSSDVIRALSNELRNYNVEICLHEEVASLWMEQSQLLGVILKKNKKKISADAVIVATGGLSYPSTGSTGDGYQMAEDTDHKVTECSPALVPFEIAEADGKGLQGLSLKNIQASVYQGRKELYTEFGEMLFTHFGVSGPVLLSASSYAAKKIAKEPLRLVIDLKPALSEEQLDDRFLREFEEAKNKQFKNALNHLYPAKMIPVIIERSKISPEKKVNELTKAERQTLVSITKNLSFTLTGLRGYQEAIITQGGVSVKEVNPSTMESKKVSGLYFAGEVLDVDAVTGGFNLQIAWSTGWLAGSSIR